MQIVLIRFIVFVEFHPFSEGLVRWKLHATRARLHTSTLVFLADESPDLPKSKHQTERPQECTDI